MIDDTDENWYVTNRWQMYDGEIRANYIRVAVVAPFYVIHWIQHYFGSSLDVTDPGADVFHIAVTVLALAWLATGLVVAMALRSQFFPRWFGTASTIVDLFIVTAILSLGGGQTSPLIMAYPLLIALCTLRVDLKLVYITTIVSLACYGFLMVLGTNRFELPTGEVGVVPRYAQAMTILAIMIAGFIGGQIVRRMRVMAAYYADRTTRSLAAAIEQASQSTR